MAEEGGLMRSMLRWLPLALSICVAAPSEAAWHEAKSAHFIIYANQDPEQLREFASRLEKFDKAVRFVRSMDDPTLSDSSKLTIYVFSGTGSVGRLVGSSDVAGMYSGSAANSVAFVPKIANETQVKKQRRSGQLDAQTVLFHEYAHHLHLQNSAAALPAWIVEGFAEFFATADFQPDGTIVLGAAAGHRAWSLLNFTDLSLQEMLSGSYERLSNVELALLYGRGWLLVHYLTFEPARAGQLNRYVSGIQNGEAPMVAAKAAFGDLKVLDRSLRRYLHARTIKALGIPPDKITTGPIHIRPLRAGEAAIMDVRIRSAAGVDRRTAPVVASEARKIAAGHSSEPEVLTALAEAELDAENYVAAEQAADRALALNPKAIRALLFKGRARMELACKQPDNANWTEIRSWFMRANRLDVDHAEPLMRFYETYLYEGVTPTRNSVEGLLYAANIAPQDGTLRLMAVRQLLADSDTEGARAMFALLAFDPHAKDKWRENAQKVIAAMTAGQAEEAAQLLELAVEAQLNDSQKRK